MKLLFFMFTILPFIAHGQSYFKCDRKKTVEITLADNPVRKLSKSKYAASGNLLIRYRQAEIICDSAVCDCKNKTVMLCGHLKFNDNSRLGAFHCDTIVLDLKTNMIYGRNVR